VVQECNKKFDGDRNVLLDDLLKVKISILKTSNLTFSDLLDKHLYYSDLTLKSKSIHKGCREMVARDSFSQLYFYRSEQETDSIYFDGIVVVPDCFEENSNKSLMLISMDGSESVISSSIDPTKNYLVLSKNERIGSVEYGAVNEESILKNGSLLAKEQKVGEGKSMKISNATFTSLKAKRTVESWFAGEPEVRLTILYSNFDHSNNVEFPKCFTYVYPRNWLKTTGSGTKVKWVDVSVECPFWTFDDQSFDRQMIWTEDDGAEEEKNVSSVEITNHVTGKKTIEAIKRTGTTGEKIIASSFVDYFHPGDGEQNWGLIKFKLEFN
jgi:hypothetical protein